MPGVPRFVLAARHTVVKLFQDVEPCLMKIVEHGAAHVRHITNDT